MDFIGFHKDLTRISFGYQMDFNITSTEFYYNFNRNFRKVGKYCTGNCPRTTQALYSAETASYYESRRFSVGTFLTMLNVSLRILLKIKITSLEIVLDFEDFLMVFIKL